MTSVSANSGIAVPRAKLKRFYWQQRHPLGETRSKCPELWIPFIYTRRKGLLSLSFPSFIMWAKKLPYSSEIQIWPAYYSTAHARATSRCRLRREIHICFCPLSLHQNFTVRPFIHHPPLPFRALAPFHHLLALSMYVPDIFVSHSSRPPFPFRRD